MEVEILISIIIVWRQLKNNIFILIFPPLKKKKLFHTCYSGYYVLSLTSFLSEKKIVALLVVTTSRKHYQCYIIWCALGKKQNLGAVIGIIMQNSKKPIIFFGKFNLDYIYLVSQYSKL